jgi:protein TonB
MIQSAPNNIHTSKNALAQTLRCLGISLLVHISVAIVMTRTIRQHDYKPDVITISLEQSFETVPVKTSSLIHKEQLQKLKLPDRKFESAVPPENPMKANSTLKQSVATEETASKGVSSPAAIPEIAELPKVRKEVIISPNGADLPVVKPTAETGTAIHANKEQREQEQRRQQLNKEHFEYIRTKVAGKTVYPPMARRMAWEGKAVVSFTIIKDGSIKNVMVTRGSGHSMLDQAALDAVKSAAPFLLPPVQSEISIPVQFTLYP